MDMKPVNKSVINNHESSMLEDIEIDEEIDEESEPFEEEELSRAVDRLVDSSVQEEFSQKLNNQGRGGAGDQRPKTSGAIKAQVEALRRQKQKPSADTLNREENRHKYNSASE